MDVGRLVDLVLLEPQRHAPRRVLGAHPWIAPAVQLDERVAQRRALGRFHVRDVPADMISQCHGPHPRSRAEPHGREAPTPRTPRRCAGSLHATHAHRWPSARSGMTLWAGPSGILLAPVHRRSRPFRGPRGTWVGSWTTRTDHHPMARRSAGVARWAWSSRARTRERQPTLVMVRATWSEPPGQSHHTRRATARSWRRRAAPARPEGEAAYGPMAAPITANGRPSRGANRRPEQRGAQVLADGRAVAEPEQPAVRRVQAQRLVQPQGVGERQAGDGRPDAGLEARSGTGRPPRPRTRGRRRRRSAPTRTTWPPPAGPALGLPGVCAGRWRRASAAAARPRGRRRRRRRGAPPDGWCPATAPPWRSTGSRPARRRGTARCPGVGTRPRTGPGAGRSRSG